jgi:diguanylate cyclase (GGDEF)-like protein/PAS domain S-box-containing protein
MRRSAILTEQVRAIERRSEQRIRALVEHSSDVVTVLGPDLRVRWQAASVRRLLGREPGSLIEVPITSIVHPDDRALFDQFLRARLDGGAPGTIRARLRHADGRWCYVETVAENRCEDPSVEGLVLNMRDVSERKAFEDELRHQAFHDALTGLANRALFEDRLRHALAGTLRAHCSLAVLFVDVDDFKTVNDSLGHRAGDVILRGVGARIDSLVRPADTAARLGGDEFAVLLEPGESNEEAHRIATRILVALADPIIVDEHRLSLTASIGIAFSDGSVQADELLRNADMAMYAAKENGKNSVRAFEQTMHRRALKRLELRGELQRALVNQEFELDYQPIVSLHTGRTVGVEALVRWQHPTRGRLAPDQFVDLAEETGLIVPLGRWILEQACAQVHEWGLALNWAQPLYVSVNVSIRQLHEHDFPQAVAGVLARTALEHQSLVLEITESLLADDPQSIIRRLLMLKHLGLRIAIDDFGTGYSALSHLQELPIDILKIDKSFTDGLQIDGQTADLVQGIINLGNSLHLEVIAEGIEQLRQADLLRALRSPFGQGFLFSPPTCPAGVLALLQAPAARLPTGAR